jgi:hypothetical protein
MNSNAVRSSTLQHCKVVALLLAAMVAAARPAVAQYDPSADFSATSNPNGVWSYGFEDLPIGSPFQLLTASAPVPSIPGPAVDSWQFPLFGTLAVLHNGTAVPQLVSTGSDNAMYDPGMLAMHPGPNDQIGIVLFTAPANGLYSIHGTFEGIDTAWTSSDVFLLHNNVPIAGGTVTGFGPGFEVSLSSAPFLLSAGDTLAYAVGGSPLHDTTALINAEVSAAVAGVPEPSSFLLLGIACIALAAWVWRAATARAPRWSTWAAS